MIFPWWSKYVAYLTILIWACGYTGIKVASHYEDKLAAIEVVAVQQEKRTKQIETKQREVVKNADKKTKQAIALSDDFYRSLLNSSPGKMPNTTGTSSGINEEAKAGSFDTSCNSSDGAADAIQIYAWQAFYLDLMKAQETLSGP